MSEKRAFLLVGGPQDGQRVVLMDGRRSHVVYLFRPARACSYDAHPEQVTLKTLEYLPVRDIPGVMAPRGTSATLVLDMLVDGYVRAPLADPAPTKETRA